MHVNRISHPNGEVSERVSESRFTFAACHHLNRAAEVERAERMLHASRLELPKIVALRQRELDALKASDAPDVWRVISWHASREAAEKAARKHMARVVAVD